MNPEAARALVEGYTQLMQGEHGATCQVLAAVKNGASDYKPDPKSRTAWELATHLATSDVWLLDCITKGAFQMDPEATKAAEAQFKTADDIVAFYKEAIPAKLAELRALPDDKLTETISFFGVMQMPAVAFIGFANNHSVHHRGQLAAYLRAMGSKVPNIYGPSADAEPAPRM